MLQNFFTLQTSQSLFLPSCYHHRYKCFKITGYFNSTLNPIIYVMTNQEFKAAFTAIVYRLLCCRHHAPARQHGSCRDNETVDFTR